MSGLGRWQYIYVLAVWFSIWPILTAELWAQKSSVAKVSNHQDDTLEEEVPSDSDAVPPAFAVRVSGGIVRLIAVTSGVAVSDYASAHEVIYSELLRDPLFWQQSVPLGLIGGTLSGLLGYFNFEYQRYLNTARCVSSLCLRFLGVHKHSWLKKLMTKLDSLAASISTEYVYLVLTSVGAILMSQREFDGVVKLLADVAIVTAGSFWGQTFFEVGAASATRRYKIKAVHSRLLQRAIQNFSDIAVTVVSAATVATQVALLKAESHWANSSLVMITAFGFATYVANMLDELRDNRKNQPKESTDVESINKASVVLKEEAPASEDAVIQPLACTRHFN